MRHAISQTERPAFPRSFRSGDEYKLAPLWLLAFLGPLDGFALVGALPRAVPVSIRAVALSAMLLRLVGVLTRRHRRFHMSYPAGGWTALAFVAMLALHTLRAPDVGEALFVVARASLWPVAAWFVAFSTQERHALKESVARIGVAAAIGHLTQSAMALFVRDRPLDALSEPYGLVWAFWLVSCGGKTEARRVVLLLLPLAVLWTGKRGAIIAMVLSVLVWVLGRFLRRGLTLSPRARPLTGALLIAVLVLAVGMIDSATLRGRFSEISSGSGRNVLYHVLADAWWSGDLGSLVFGRGLGSVSSYTGEYFGTESGIGKEAHSDVLAFAFQFGALGLILLALFHIELWARGKRLRRVDYDLFLVLRSAHISVALCSLYSSCMLSAVFAYIAILLGVCRCPATSPSRLSGS